ncbi:30S ribosomal protein S1 [Saccharicrinis sp. FJH2]|uniref:30S ribosomal protein S1 n=1 Tax=unclassified Saccharicrinis TaxID=2646859 RepID=UPI0035D4CF0A
MSQNEEKKLENQEPQEEVKDQVEQVEETKQEEAPVEEPKEETEAAPAAEEIPETKEEEVVEEAPAAEVKEEVAEPVAKKEVVKEEKTAAKATASDDFDWAAFERGDEVPDKEASELEKIYDGTLSTIAEKEVVEGTVISMNKREVVVNIGFKSDGIVSLNEFRYNPDLKVGDTVEVYIENQEDKKGQLVLSHKKARAMRSWDRVNAALDNDEVIKGYIKCRTKGGMIVDVFGIEAFLPGSQIDVKPIRDYDIYVGKTMEFKVVKINQEFRNVVVSHKALIEAELEEQKKQIIQKLEKGQVLEGTVKNITSYGVFIDLGGVDGLIHITDLSWGRVTHPEEIVQLDQKLNVVILDFDDDKKRIALGLKQLTPHPWDSLDEELKVGDKVKGKVVVLADYGAFVEIAPGVEGLIHVSEMSWSQHLRSAQDFLKVGDDVEAVILTLDRDERKMSLGIKQLKEDPWASITEKYSVGTKHTATVRNFTNFGVFVEIEEGVDGLIHISDLSWTKKIKHPAEFTQIGADIEVVVLEIDMENRRLSLGHKQLEENPWDVFETIFSEGSIHEGTIIELFDKGAVVSLPYGVEGFATPKHLVKEDGVQAKMDEKLEFKVIEFNKDSKRIIVSHSRVFEDEKRAEDKAKRKSQASSNKKGMKKVVDNLEKTTLGDVTDLAALKDQLEAAAKPKAKKAAAPKKAETAEPKAEAKTEVKEEAKEAKEEKATPAAEVKAEKSEKVEEPKAEEEAPKAKTKAKAKEADEDAKEDKE